METTFTPITLPPPDASTSIESPPPQLSSANAALREDARRLEEETIAAEPYVFKCAGAPTAGPLAEAVDRGRAAAMVELSRVVGIPRDGRAAALDRALAAVDRMHATVRAHRERLRVALEAHKVEIAEREAHDREAATERAALAAGLESQLDPAIVARVASATRLLMEADAAAESMAQALAALDEAPPETASAIAKWSAKRGQLEAEAASILSLTRQRLADLEAARAAQRQALAALWDGEIARARGAAAEVDAQGAAEVERARAALIRAQDKARERSNAAQRRIAQIAHARQEAGA